MKKPSGGKYFHSAEQDEAAKLAASGKQWGNAECMDKKCGCIWVAIYSAQGAKYLQCPICKKFTGTVKHPQKPL